MVSPTTSSQCIGTMNRRGIPGSAGVSPASFSSENDPTGRLDASAPRQVHGKLVARNPGLADTILRDCAMDTLSCIQFGPFLGWNFRKALLLKGQRHRAFTPSAARIA